MKKIKFFIMSMLIFTSFAVPVYAYNDTENHWANEIITKMSGYKIVNGYNDGSFKPDDYMTRAEFITVVNRILCLDVESNRYIPDVNRNDWYYSEIRKVVQAGIVNGNEAGYILPNNFITREEAMVILTRAFKLKEDVQLSEAYNDSEMISEWAKASMFAAITQGYIKGYEDNTIRPKDNITRAEVLVLIDRIFPNVLTINVYEGVINGDVLIFDDNIVLNKLTINGNVLISNKSLRTLKSRNVTINGNVILKDKEAESIKDFKILGNVYEFLTEENEFKGYTNEQYGIRFAIPDSGKVVLYEKDKEINYKEKDLIVMDIRQEDELYLKGIESIAKVERNKYDYIFMEIEKGIVGKESKFVHYKEKSGNEIIIIKRENIVYVLRIYNVISDNFSDNIIATIQLFETEMVKDTPNKVYKNSKLALKFIYKDKYVVVDDSYNTNVINEEKGFFKLFIQVNTITDIHKYSVEQLKELLGAIAKEDGEIEETETLKIINNNAIKFKMNDDGRITHSLYVVIGNNLYNLIFKGDEADMNEIGEEMFNDIVRTLEF